ncbi:hypothetical protein LCM20_12970 [Halobacillus litoralis]|uniref:hypothetical protein n=1 Tax=Halobacillus litoralis TaxID=45668 RepID=UPI001CD2E247|nr:hypothetical protein [Halobacillus litoralis]MCA0971511.1 hypothetical protein [Halobacillus litoralis]
MNDLLQQINEKEAYCWKCRASLSSDEVMVLEESDTRIAELCYDCYEEMMRN